MAIGGSVDGEHRRAELAEVVRVEGRVMLDDAARRFGVSTMTIRRDLELLEADGLLRRVRGGAVGVPAPQAYGDRLVTRAAAKRVIAQKALELLPETGAVALDASTTTNALARLLGAREGLTVTTNSVETFQELCALPGVEALLTGGSREPSTGSLVGPLAGAGARSVHTSMFLASAAGVRAETGSSEVSLAEADVKRQFASCAERTVLCVDSSKLDQASMGTALELDAVAILVTELSPSDARLDAYRERVEVV